MRKIWRIRLHQVPLSEDLSVVLQLPAALLFRVWNRRSEAQWLLSRHQVSIRVWTSAFFCHRSSIFLVVASKSSGLPRQQTSHKRQLSPIEVSDDDLDTPVVKRSRPKAGDFPFSHRSHLLRSCGLLRVALITENAFPDGLQLDVMAYECFDAANYHTSEAQITASENDLRIVRADRLVTLICIADGTSFIY